MYKRGFTVFELAIVIAIIAVVGVASFSFGLPALGSVGCTQEKETALIAVTRARHAAQFLDRGNVKLNISGNGYEILALGNDLLPPLLIDIFARETSVPVTATNIIFEKENGVLVQDSAQIMIGETQSSCQEIISINKFGVIN